MSSGTIDQSEGPSENLLIILPMPEPTALVEHLRFKFPRITVRYLECLWSGPDAWKAAKKVPVEVFRDATVLYTLSELPPDPIQNAPNLKLVHFFSAGINNAANHPVYTDTDITLTTSSGIHGPQIGEWVILTALVQSHAYNTLHDLQKEHKWGKSAGDLLKLRDMVGQRLGILGYGSIGRQVARIAKALGMTVLAFTASPKNTAEERRDHGFIVSGTGDAEGTFPSEWYSGLDRENLHKFLAQDLDMLLISVPLTKETHNLISTAEFSILRKRRAFISNISRGKIIDQDALIAAVRNGDVRGAALDVTDPEPLPEDNPLWDFPNVTITPHISGLGSAYAERSFAILQGNLEKKARGDKLWNVVDRKRGY